MADTTRSLENARVLHEPSSSKSPTPGLQATRINHSIQYPPHTRRQSATRASLAAPQHAHQPLRLSPLQPNQCDDELQLAAHSQHERGEVDAAISPQAISAPIGETTRQGFSFGADACSNGRRPLVATPSFPPAPPAPAPPAVGCTLTATTSSTTAAAAGGQAQRVEPSSGRNENLQNLPLRAPRTPLFPQLVPLDPSSALLPASASASAQSSLSSCAASATLANSLSRLGSLASTTPATLVPATVSEARARPLLKATSSDGATKTSSHKPAETIAQGERALGAAPANGGASSAPVSGESPFLCNLCQRDFLSTQALNAHMRAHPEALADRRPVRRRRRGFGLTMKKGHWRRRTKARTGPASAPAPSSTATSAKAATVYAAAPASQAMYTPSSPSPCAAPLFGHLVPCHSPSNTTSLSPSPLSSAHATPPLAPAASNAVLSSVRAQPGPKQPRDESQVPRARRGSRQLAPGIASGISAAPLCEPAITPRIDTTPAAGCESIPSSAAPAPSSRDGSRSRRKKGTLSRRKARRRVSRTASAPSAASSASSSSSVSAPPQRKQREVSSRRAVRKPSKAASRQRGSALAPLRASPASEAPTPDARLCAAVNSGVLFPIPAPPLVPLGLTGPLEPMNTRPPVNALRPLQLAAAAAAAAVADGSGVLHGMSGSDSTERPTGRPFGPLTPLVCTQPLMAAPPSLPPSPVEQEQFFLAQAVLNASPRPLPGAAGAGSTSGLLPSIALPRPVSASTSSMAVIGGNGQSRRGARNNVRECGKTAAVNRVIGKNSKLDQLIRAAMSASSSAS